VTDLIKHVKDKRWLLIVDNWEHIIEPVASAQACGPAELAATV
jgi:hypothetical protein